MRQAREETQSLNEHVELDEAKMSAAQIAKLKKAYGQMRVKRLHDKWSKIKFNHG